MKKLLSLLFLLQISVLGFAQQYSTGLNFDDNKYSEEPMKATLLTRDYTVLPTRASLKQYCPTPKNQGSYGTCVGWSSAYAARSIVEANQNEWTDKSIITENAFSGTFVYKHIKQDTDANCQWGSWIADAMQLMVNKGVPKYKDFNIDCPSSISTTIYNKAADHKIKSYARLHNADDSKNMKIRTVKKALANGNPVVFGMKCPSSFHDARGVWTPSENPNNAYGGHAMCVIGYDNNKYGGAFEIMNSWGTGWGNDGFVWIKYDDFAAFTKYSFEMIAIPKKKPEDIDLSGELQLVLATGTQMNASYVNTQNNLGYYKMNKAYSSGTRFRLYISNNEPAFVYAIGTDATQKIFQIFPHKENISAALNYKSNNVAIPDESHYVQMDNTKGTDYLCVLYSKEPININALKKQLESQTGNFPTRINAVLGNKLVKSASFSNGTIKFQAKSKGKTVVALVVETEHI